MPGVTNPRLQVLESTQDYVTLLVEYIVTPLPIDIGSGHRYEEVIGLWFDLAGGGIKLLEKPVGILIFTQEQNEYRRYHRIDLSFQRLREVVGVFSESAIIQAKVTVTQMLERGGNYSEGFKVHIPEIPPEL